MRALGEILNVKSGRKASAVFGRIASIFVMLGLSMVFLLATMDQADARRRHHRVHKRHYVHHKVYKRTGGYTPAYAEMVYDANSGKVLTATNPDAPRHPASITKVMTLYMLFDQLERGRMKLDTELSISSHAASQSPSKLGVKAGSTIEVEDAIKAVVTRSANDVASAIGENIAGSEDAFAQMMTRKAREIGMSRTTFKNASGLPHPENLTTARDLVTLGRSIQDKYPRYYKYFAIRSFEYKGQNIGNHNRLLGRVEGVDGIKTGYTRASGFNLLTSARVDGRRVIAVVLGGRSGRIRDAQMASLLDRHLENASTTARHNVQMAEAEGDSDEETVAVKPATQVAAAQIPTPVAAPVRLADKPKPAVISEITRPKATATGPAVIRVGAATPVVASTTPTGPVMRWNTGAQPKSIAQSDIRVGQPTDPNIRKSMGLRAAVESEEPATTASIRQPAQIAVAEATKIDKPEPVAIKTASRSGWVIQVAATDNEDKAKTILSTAKLKNQNVLGKAESFTEKVQKGGTTLYRARFAGFESGSAETACKALKRSGYACFAQHI